MINRAPGRILVIFCLGYLAATASVLGTPPDRVPADVPDAAARFDQIVSLVQRNFYDAQTSGQPWRDRAAGLRAQALAATDDDQFARIINDMLGTLQASHTHYYTARMPEYYQLLGVFERGGAYRESLDAVRRRSPKKEIAYEGIGIATLSHEGRIYVQSVYDGLPADRSGLLVGDELVTVDGRPFHPILSFAGKAGRQVKVQLRRRRRTVPQTLNVRPQWLAGKTMFETAMKASARVLNYQGTKVAYVHAWSYSGRDYQDLLVDLLSQPPLSKADALLLDLRDGWGGASPGFLTIFDRDVPRLTMTRRDGTTTTFDQQWRKPAALLVNERSRSGKEAYAYGFQQLGIGPVVGRRSAGAVLAGGLFFLDDLSVLYLAVADVKVDDECLEGRGVSPDVKVERPIPYSAGHDPQQQEAVRQLADICRTRSTSAPPADQK